jgi:hypothetical protein
MDDIAGLFEIEMQLGGACAGRVVGNDDGGE